MATLQTIRDIVSSVPIQYLLDTDPVAYGVDADIGALLVRTDSPGVYYKSGPLPSNWTVVGNGGQSYYIDPRWFGAVGDGVTDDTVAFTNAFVAAGLGGTVIVPLGTWINDSTPFADHEQALDGTGMWSRIKTKVGAVYALEMDSKLNCRVSNLMIDGRARASGGLLVTATTPPGTSQHPMFSRVKFVACLIGALITGTTGAPPNDQVDKNNFDHCEWEDCATGLKIDSTNAELCSVTASAFNSCDVGIQASHGTLLVQDTGFQFNQNNQIGILMDGVNFDWLNLRNVWMEPAVGLIGCVALQGTQWPTCGVIAEHCTFVKMDVVIGPIGGAGTTSTFVARGCRFIKLGGLGGDITTTVADAVFCDEYNSFEGGAAWVPAGAAAVSSHRHQWTYQGYWHWEGAVLSARIYSNGNLYLPNLGNYANNGAALAAGLAVGDLYRTAGAVMVVV